MGVSKLRLLHESLRRYMRRQAWDHLDVLIGKTRDEELASVMAQMGEEQQVVIWEHLPTDARRANVITLMDSPFGQNILNPLPAPDALSILQEMAPDDMADILADLLPEKATAILELLEELVALLLGGAARARHQGRPTTSPERDDTIMLHDPFEG